MGTSDWWEVLEAWPVADEADWLRHAAAFAGAFVIPTKRERWVELLTRRPRRIFSNSHKLRSDLDPRRCRLVASLPDPVPATGLFYGFFDSPRVVPAENAAVATAYGDAIFSLVPGELAAYFFHEGETWLCRT